MKNVRDKIEDFIASKKDFKRGTFETDSGKIEVILRSLVTEKDRGNLGMHLMVAKHDGKTYSCFSK